MNDIHAIVRYVQVSDMLATSGQPSEEQLAAVAAAGFQTIINLALHDDPRYSLKDEAGTVRSLGMEYIHIPVQFSSPQPSDLSAFCAAMARAEGRKVLVHCAHNKRVPVFVALDRVLRLHWDADRALAAVREVWQPDATWSEFIAKALASQKEKS